MAVDAGSMPGILEARVSRKGATATLALAGEFDLAGVDAVRAKFAEACVEEPARVVIDLSRLTFIDSTGISFLLSTVKADEGGRVSFVAAHAPGVQRVFAITGLSGLFGGAGEATPLSGACQ